MTKRQAIKAAVDAANEACRDGDCGGWWVRWENGKTLAAAYENLEIVEPQAEAI